KESGMKFLWAPEKGKDGSGRFFWENILKVKKGDIIFNYSEGELKGISLASNDGYKAVNKDAQSPWSPNGYRVDIDLILLDPSINSEIFTRNISSFNTHLAQIYNKPFSANGSINQGYLYEFSKEAGRYIRDIYNKPFGNKVIDEFFDNVKLNKKDINIFEVCDISILTAIKTKPFILLAGISGTGKSRLVRTLAYKTCSKKELRNDPRKPGNYELIPVRPNWHDSSELLGYVSRINGEKYITTTFMKFIAKAWKHTDIPFFLCLDEMNLAPVEQYFAEYLSIIETRQEKNGELVTDFIISKNNFENPNLYTNLLTDLELSGSEFDEGISIPGNLIVIGTVNMDETTHSFSRKVLDRAMTFEMNNVDLTAGLELFESDWSYPNSYIASDDVIGKYTSGAEVYSQIFKEKDEVIGFLNNINKELDGTPFKIAYRVRDEFLIYCFYASKHTTADWLTKALDEMTSMKILSRIEGDETKTGMVLTNLQRIITPDFKKSNAKIKEMETRLQANGYTSFWS
ncbi:MAG: McrB family protein, partial [Ignavibacteria bacterium]